MSREVPATPTADAPRTAALPYPARFAIAMIHDADRDFRGDQDGECLDCGQVGPMFHDEDCHLAGFSAVERELRTLAVPAAPPVDGLREPEHGWKFGEPRTQALRDAYWQHRERPNVHSHAPCQDKCFPDITERWVNLMVERAALASPRSDAPDDRCSACHGTRWTEDENWSPDYPESWDGSRSPGNGLIPCGFCNEGGWDIPVGERPSRGPDEEAANEPNAGPTPFMAMSLFAAALIDELEDVHGCTEVSLYRETLADIEFEAADDASRPAAPAAGAGLDAAAYAEAARE